MQKSDNYPQFNRATVTQRWESNNQIEISPSASPMPETSFPSGEILLVPISFATVVWMLLFAMHFNLWKSVRNRMGSLQKNRHQLPCTNCQYFKNNPYLKCAVHPDRVLKSEATNCPDYWAYESSDTK
jgi:hypothetical protein